MFNEGVKLLQKIQLGLHDENYELEVNIAPNDNYLIELNIVPNPDGYLQALHLADKLMSYKFSNPAHRELEAQKKEELAQTYEVALEKARQYCNTNPN
jgi:hypothetical protein